MKIYANFIPTCKFGVTCLPVMGSMRVMVVVPVVVRGARGHDQVELALLDAALAAYGIGQTAHGTGRPTQDDGLDAVLIIQMRVHGGHRQAVVGVLDARQPLS